MLSAAALAIFAFIIIGGLFMAEEATSQAGMRNKALFLAQEGLEAARDIRDQNFSNLSNGTYGISVTGTASFLGSSDITDGIYTRTVTVSDVSTGIKKINSQVSWSGFSRSQSVSLNTYLSHFK